MKYFRSRKSRVRTQTSSIVHTLSSNKQVELLAGCLISFNENVTKQTLIEISNKKPVFLGRVGLPETHHFFAYALLEIKLITQILLLSRVHINPVVDYRHSQFWLFTHDCSVTSTKNLSSNEWTRLSPHSCNFTKYI